MHLLDIEMSCGVRNMSGLTDDPRQLLLSLDSELFDDTAFVQWSDVWGRYENGNKLYHYVRKQFPRSSIIRTKPARNPNSGNRICVYTWKIPKNFSKWCVKNRKKDGKSSGPNCDDYCRRHGCDCGGDCW